MKKKGLAQIVEIGPVVPVPFTVTENLPFQFYIYTYFLLCLPSIH